MKKSHSGFLFCLFKAFRFLLILQMVNEQKYLESERRRSNRNAAPQSRLSIAADTSIRLTVGKRRCRFCRRRRNRLASVYRPNARTGSSYTNYRGCSSDTKTRRTGATRQRRLFCRHRNPPERICQTEVRNARFSSRRFNFERYTTNRLEW